MFKSLIDKARRWMQRMGLMQGLDSVFSKKEISIPEKMYSHIDQWKALYQGYYEDWHKIKYHTIQDGEKTRVMRTLKLAKVAAEEQATLVFNERCAINISDETIKDEVTAVLDANGFRKEFQRYLEYMFALGGMVVKAHVEGGDGGEIKLSYVKADSFIPTGWTNKKITEGVFLNETVKGEFQYTHLEWHVWDDGIYYVRHELYKAKAGSNELGTEVGIKELYPDLDSEVKFEDVDHTVFVYFKSNTANNVDMDSPLGISIFANALDTLHSIDVAFDSFEREFRLGKKRIMVPESAVRVVIDKKTGETRRYFDASDEVYQAFKFDGDEDPFKDVSVELRVEEHINAINSLLNLFAMQIGFSSGSFSFDGESMKTATEVVSENSKTFRTKQSHETIIEEGIIELVEIIIMLADIYGVFPRPAKDLEVTVTFDDSVAEDKMGDLQYWIQLVSSEMVSKKRALNKLLGLTEEEIEEELKQIAEERRQVQPESIDFFGINSDEKT